MKPDWKGVFPAIATQFREDESLDIEATLAHLEHLEATGIDGVIVLGTLGEGASLDPGEKLEFIESAVHQARGRLPVLACVAETTTAGAVRFAREARHAGVQGLMVLPAIVYRSDEDETIAHFETVARAVDLPLMIYNNPVTYSVDLLPEAFARLAHLDPVVAIKESSDDPRRINDLVRLHGDRFALFCGVDDLVIESYAVGAIGWVAGLVNAFPRENAALWRALEESRWKDARSLYRWFAPLLHLDTHPKLAQYIKLAMQEEGVGSERCRAPRLPLQGQERERVLGIVREAQRTRPRVA